MIVASSKPQPGKSLAETHPDVAAQADGWDPTTVKAGSHKKLAWKCNLGHRWEAHVSDRSNGNGCAICSGRAVLPGYNDLATVNPELATQADGWDPTTVTSRSNKKVAWKCHLGHKWQTQIAARSNGNGCAICSGRAVLPGYNDLATVNPELATQADGWDPTTVTSGSKKKMRWKCHLGHTWESEVHRRSSGADCPVCSGRNVLTGFNDLATVNPELSAQADGWDPTTVTVGSEKKVGWVCSFGHRWNAPVKNRTNGSSCPICSGSLVLYGYNDLATVNPELATQADGWDPTTVTVGSSKRLSWVCSLGHKWITTPNNRASGNNCPSCANHGYDPNRPGYFYLIEHLDLELFQIGITNSPKSRIRDHERRGWVVIELRGPMDGHLTRQLEISSLFALKSRGAIFGSKSSLEKFSGYSEAWTKPSLKVTSIKQILDWVYEDERN